MDEFDVIPHGRCSIGKSIHQLGGVSVLPGSAVQNNNLFVHPPCSLPVCTIRDRPHLLDIPGDGNNKIAACQNPCKADLCRDAMFFLRIVTNQLQFSCFHGGSFPIILYFRKRPGAARVADNPCRKINTSVNDLVGFTPVVRLPEFLRDGLGGVEVIGADGAGRLHRSNIDALLLQDRRQRIWFELLKFFVS